MVRVALILCLISSLGCRWPWQKQEKPVPKGRIIKDALSLYEMGRNLEINGNYPAAILKYQDSLEVSPRPKAYLALGQLETDLNRFAEARENIEKALELVPGDPDAKKAMERLTAIENLVKSGQEVPKSILDRPAPPRLSPAERGKARESAQKEGRGQTTPPVAVSEETSHAGLVMPDAGEPSVGKSRLPDVTSHENEPKSEALSEAEEAKVKDTISKSLDLVAAEDYAQAEETLRSSLLEFPNEGRLYYYLGYACQMEHKPRSALEAYDDAIRTGYRTASTYYNTGLCYEELGGSDLAVKAYRKTIDMGGLPAAHYTLGMLYEKRGEPDEALKEFEAYLNSAPGGEYTEDASVHVDRLKRRR